MGLSTETRRNLAIGFAILIALSSVLVNHVAATDGGLNLPSTLVRIEVSNGTESYFNTTLSDVPSGYDVTNGTYLGWCVDTTAEMARSPATHEVKLYSSSNPPGTLASEKWDMVNYILNHKQGTVEDIQQAMWYFIDMVGNYTPTSTVAWAIVNDTLANGSGFIPAYGQTIAVICYPVVLFPGAPDVQVSIIEVSIPLHDVALASVVPSSTEVNEGASVNITVVIKNNGNFTETFNVTVYANTTIIQTQTASNLAPAAQTTLTFIWNTTGVPLGNYTIKAEASIVPGETHAADNIKVNGIVHVIPEFPSAAIPLLFALATLPVVIVYRKKSAHSRAKPKTLS